MMLKKSPPDARDETAPDGEYLKPAFCVLGAGPAGLAFAIAAASCGEQVVLIEKHKPGGTSLSYGTVPAAALAAAAEAAAGFRSAAGFGIAAFEPVVDWPKVAARTRETIAALAPNASAERLSGLGVRVIAAAGRFIDHKTLAAGEHRIEARRFVIATGTSPAMPEIKGLRELPVFTTETIFDNREPIDHLVVIGGGPAGCQLAQAHRRLGARVTVIEQGRILARFDPELTEVVRNGLTTDGIKIHENARVEAVAGAPRRIEVQGLIDGKPARIECSHVLIACGRKPVIADIGLDLGKVAVTSDGVKVDRRLRTSNRRIYAIGDVTGHPHSNQRAEYHARQLATALALGRTAPVDSRTIPVAIYTDPELAQVGLTEAEARKLYGRIEVHRFPLRENVRAVASRRTDGHIKVTADRSGRILGVGIACRSAAELIDVWSLAISKRMTLADMAGWLAPHPTLGEVNRKAATHRPTTISRYSASRAWGKLLARLG